MYNIVQKRKIFFIFSSLLILPGVVFLFLGGLKLGIDFTGGSVAEFDVPARESSTTLTTYYSELDIEDTTVNFLGDTRIRITSQEINSETHVALLSKIADESNNIKEVSFASIGPTIGSELKDKAIMATVFVMVFIVLYITWAFRKSTIGPMRSWVFAASAFVALIHDLLIVIGIFAILGYFFEIKIDVLFVTSLLTVLGFSVHDSIVVFDRVRERLKLQESNQTFEDVVNISVSQTLVRSLATSLTTVLVLTTLLIFGGESIRYFVIALLIGMIAGTYSSICIASPLLVTWKNYKESR